MEQKTSFKVWPRKKDKTQTKMNTQLISSAAELTSWWTKTYLQMKAEKNLTARIWELQAATKAWTLTASTPSTVLGSPTSRQWRRWKDQARFWITQRLILLLQLSRSQETTQPANKVEACTSDQRLKWTVRELMQLETWIETSLTLSLCKTTLTLKAPASTTKVFKCRSRRNQLT